MVLEWFVPVTPGESVEGVLVLGHDETHPPVPDSSAPPFPGRPHMVGDFALSQFELASDGTGVRMRCEDTGLSGERFYYYSLFPYRTVSNRRSYVTDVRNRAVGYAASPFDGGAALYDLLPGVHHRYDTSTPPSGAKGFSAIDKTKGELRRFLDLPGGELDLMRSLAASLLHARDPYRVDGRLLDVLARWIGWKTNHGLDYGEQRQEIRMAPHVFESSGTIPMVESTVTRISGWNCRTKEYIHNIFRTNDPEMGNLWMTVRSGEGVWEEMKLASLDQDFAGYLSCARDASGNMRLYYQKKARKGWNIWRKTAYPLIVEGSGATILEDLVITPSLREDLAAEGVILDESAHAVLTDDGVEIHDPLFGETYLATILEGAVSLRNRDEAVSWTPSRPVYLDDREGILHKSPSVVWYDQAFREFWNRYDSASGRWEIVHRFLTDDESLPPVVFQTETDDPSHPMERRDPGVVTDGAGRLWLFWRERSANGWIGYSSHLRTLNPDGSAVWSAPTAMRAAGGEEMRPETPPSFVSLSSPERIRAVWSRREWTGYDGESGPAGGRRMRLYTAECEILEEVGGPVPVWGEARALLPAAASNYDDRDPALSRDPDGSLHLAFVSNRSGSPSVHYLPVRSDGIPDGSPLNVTNGYYNESYPLPTIAHGRLAILFRSGASLDYEGKVYTGTRTLDARYGGSLSLDVRNMVKTSLRGMYDDFQRYVIDTGTENHNRYDRGTIGVFLDPRRNPRSTIVSSDWSRFSEALSRFLPIQVRPVFVMQTYREERYDTLERVTESYLQEMEAATGENVILAPDELLRDRPLGWRLLLSVDVTGTDSEERHTNRTSADPGQNPPEVSHRTYHEGLDLSDEAYAEEENG